MRLITLLTLCFYTLVSTYSQPVADKEGRVTLRYTSRTATEVSVKGDKAVEGKMTREGEQWTLTTPPLPSDIYMYAFVEDEEHRRCDPHNPWRERDIADTVSLFCVKGWPGTTYMDNDVPHGTVLTPWYPSTMNGMKQRRMTVYLPPQYADDTTRRYPVMYLLHGSGGDEEAWLAMGRLRQIMDNMIAAGNCEPMIVVMPNGNADLDAAPGKSPYRQALPKAKNITSMTGVIETHFTEEVMAYTEKNYRTKAGKDNRAIAGLSLGGLHTIHITANNPEKFAYIGLFSPQTDITMSDKTIGSVRTIADNISNMAASLPFVSKEWKDRVGQKMQRTENMNIYTDMEKKLKQQFAEPPRLYYIAVGRDDMIKHMTDKYRQRLDNIGCGYIYNETEGGHTWQNWRRYLLDFLPRIFR